MSSIVVSVFSNGFVFSDKSGLPELDRRNMDGRQARKRKEEGPGNG